MKSLVSRFVKDESGATAIEYGLIAAGISVAIITVVNGLGTKLETTFTKVKDSLVQSSTASAPSWRPPSRR
jgi:pilus assembly protein Flp/PilA